MSITDIAHEFISDFSCKSICRNNFFCINQGVFPISSSICSVYGAILCFLPSLGMAAIVENRDYNLLGLMMEYVFMLVFNLLIARMLLWIHTGTSHLQKFIKFRVKHT